ncbi:TetR/AcrR family transcriptional regulator [Amorphus sp. MBR-141]
MNKPVQPPERGKSAATASSAKRAEILEGARRVFRAEGFDGASMDKIAQAAKVSKGTLYVYFRNKEELFQALVMVDRQEAAEQMCIVTDDEADIDATLLGLGERFLTMMTAPQHIALIRMVMGAAEKFPDAGRTFFEMGPCFGINRLADYLDRQVERGRLTIDEDTTFAAANFLNLCHGTIVKRLLFGFLDTPDEAEIKATVESAVRMFLKAYGTKG